MTSVEDRILIEDTLYRYASSIDSANPDALYDVLHPDLWAQYGNADPAEGADTVIGIRAALTTLRVGVGCSDGRQGSHLSTQLEVPTGRSAA